MMGTRLLSRVAVVGVLATATFLGVPVATAGAATQTCFIVHGRADRTCTPGVRNPDVTQATIHQTICVPGYSRRIRPPASYTTKLKNEQKIVYGEANIPNADLEEDHLIPLSVGGAPRDPRNLWPEPRDSRSDTGEGAESKDTEEYQLYRNVCADRVALAAAQRQIVAHWTH
jgi:hypothetical protein